MPALRRLNRGAHSLDEHSGLTGLCLTAIDAVLGSPCMVVEQTADGFTQRESRNPDGVWCGPCGARRKGLSAVLSTERIDPWDFAVRRGGVILLGDGAGTVLRSRRGRFSARGAGDPKGMTA